MKKPDLLCMRPVERIDRLGGGLQQHLAALFREIRLGFRREMVGNWISEFMRALDSDDPKEAMRARALLLQHLDGIEPEPLL